MSGRICRETYANYGSYLRSRGYDKAICDLIDMIESGKIPVGPFIPVDKCNAILNGTLEIIECDGNIPGPHTGGVQSGMGQLWVQGGFNGPLGLARDLSIQAANGINSSGAIIQTAPSSFSVHIPNVGNISDHNYFESKTFLHGGLTMSDSINTSPSSVLTTITSIVKSDSSGLTVPWPDPTTSTNDFPNDYTLATTKAIYKYVSSLADPKLKYVGNSGNSIVDLTADTFNIVGTTGNIETTASGSSPNPSLTIDLADITPDPSGMYGSPVVNGGLTTQYIKVPKITVDQKGRLTAASEDTIDVMSSFTVVDGTTSSPPSYMVKNGGEIDFTVGSNLTVNVSSSAPPVGAGATIEYGLKPILTSLTDVQTDKLTIPSSGSNSITSIVSSITGTGASDELATTDAIITAISSGSGVQTVTSGNANTITVGGTGTAPTISANTGSVTANATHLVTGGAVHTAISGLMTSWKLEDNNSPVGSVTIDDGKIVQVSSTTKNIAVAVATGTPNTLKFTLDPQLTGMTSINAIGNTANLELSQNGGVVKVVGNCEIGTSNNSSVDIASGNGLTTIHDQLKLDLLQLYTGGNSATQLQQYHLLGIKKSGGGNINHIFDMGYSFDQISFSQSSLRYKENVEIMTEEAAADLMKIMPRTFNYKGSNDETFGLIAEELAGTELKAAVGNDKEGRPDSINYSMLVAPLLRIVQDQNERIKALEEKVEALSK